MADKEQRSTVAAKEEAPEARVDAADQQVTASNAEVAAQVATNEPALDTGWLDEVGVQEDVSPVDAAAERMAALAEGRRDPTDGTVDPEALAAEAAAFNEAIAGMTPEQQAEFLDRVGVQTATDMLRAAQEAGDPAAVQAVVDALAASAEGLDEASLAKLAEGVLAGASPEVADSLVRALASGAGAKLAVELSYHEGASEALGWNFGMNVDSAMSWGTHEFEAAANAADTVRAELAAGAVRLRELGLSEEEVAEWQAEYQAQYQHVLDAYEEKAAWYAGTLDARAIAHEKGGEFAEGHYSFDAVDRLAASEAGGKEAAEAVFAAGQGDATWLEHLPPEDRERWVARGAMEGVAALASTGDVAGLDQLLAGVEKVSPDDAEAVAALREKLAGIDTSGDPEAVQAAIAEAFAAEEGAEGLTARLSAAAGLGVAVAALGQVSADDFDSGASALGRGFARLGAGLDALGRLTPDELGRFQENLGAHLAVDVAGFLSTFIRSPGLSAGVGAVIGVIDAALYISEGNYEAAGLALLPTIGAGIGSLFGPVGTLVGGIAGAAISALLGALGVGTPDQIQAITEPIVQRALVERGWAPEMATRYAELLSSEGFGPQLTAAAEALGTNADDLLRALAEAPLGYVDRFLADVQQSVRIGEDDAGGRTVDVNDYLTRMYGDYGPAAAAADENYEGTLYRRNEAIIEENKRRIANG